MGTSETIDTSSPPTDNHSRPQYGRLKARDHAQWNVVVAEDAGISAVLDMLDQAPEDFSARTHLVYLHSGSAAEQTLRSRLDQYESIGVEEVASAEQALKTLDDLLASAKMGTQLYLAGGESFLSLAVNTALRHGVNHASITTELVGSLARRVQCVHCKYIAEDITTSYYNCPECEEYLLVRDHYSRRLAAYQGVAATIETPGEKPEAEEVYR